MENKIERKKNKFGARVRSQIHFNSIHFNLIQLFSIICFNLSQRPFGRQQQSTHLFICLA